MSNGEGKTPTVYVVAGPNGAGKTTFTRAFLPDFVQCREFVNADLIAAGLSPFAPENQAIRAGRLLLTRIKELSEARQDFGFETTLAGRGYIKLLGDLKQTGYRVVLFFLWLPTADLAAARVANRVSQGGHNIPEATIRRRFEAGIRNLFESYCPVLDECWLYDGSHLPPRLVVVENQGVLDVLQTESYASITTTWRPSSHE
jgi:predicted ABC-type ATPase